MADRTGVPPTADISAAYGYCAWHRGHARGVRLVRVFDAGSGPGTSGNLFACLPCRQAYDLTPLADRP